MSRVRLTTRAAGPRARHLSATRRGDVHPTGLRLDHRSLDSGVRVRLGGAIAMVLLAVSRVAGQSPAPPDTAVLQEVTHRGRYLAACVAATTHARRVLPPVASGVGVTPTSICIRRGGGEWQILFGNLEAQAGELRAAGRVVVDLASGTTSRIESLDEYESGEERMAATAARKAAQWLPLSERPYDMVVVPASDTAWMVYWFPQRQREGYYPHGGDYRLTISRGGSEILEARRMHSAIIELGPPPPEAKYGGHTAVLRDGVEDTDVFLVLWREPRMPEVVLTQNWRFVMDTSGAIAWSKRR